VDNPDVPTDLWKGEAVVENKNLILGHYEYTLDKKNRLFIPAKHREALGSTFVVGPSFTDNSLTVFSCEDFTDIVTKTMAMDVEIQDEIQSQFISKCNEFAPDDQGRITLSADLVSLGELSGTVIIEGAGFRAKIWSTERFAAKNAEPPKHTLAELAKMAKF